MRCTEVQFWPNSNYSMRIDLFVALLDNNQRTHNTLVKLELQPILNKLTGTHLSNQTILRQRNIIKQIPAINSQTPAGPSPIEPFLHPCPALPLFNAHIKEMMFSNHCLNATKKGRGELRHMLPQPGSGVQYGVCWWCLQILWSDTNLSNIPTSSGNPWSFSCCTTTGEKKTWQHFQLCFFTQSIAMYTHKFHFTQIDEPSPFNIKWRKNAKFFLRM